MNIREIECKSVITKSKLPDADYVINPYVGCSHGCVYCYARFISRFTGHNHEKWGSFMDVKRGGKIAGKLDGKNILFGSVTDPYNPLEVKYRTTREILERLLEQKTGANIEILTKSPLVLRDIELLKQMPHIRVGVSLSTLDAHFARITETHAASPQQRMDTIHALHQAGITTYLFVSPIFPYLSDWRGVANAAFDYTDMVCFENLNLRADYRPQVLEIIQTNYPEVYPKFANIYSDKRLFREYWNEEAAQIRAYMGDRKHKIYFFHEEIKKK